MQGFFFGDPNQRLFGVRHEPERTPRRTAVLLCPSWGLEYMRCYRALNLLAEALAARGFDTLRFDYSCTGDSSGYTGEASLERWFGDIHRAARELQDLSHAPRLCVLGLRLGALLAAGAIAEGLPADRLVVWDMPASGRDWLNEMVVMDQAITAYKNRYRVVGTKLQTAPHEELVGVPLPGPLREKLATLSPALPSPAERVLSLRSQGSPAAGAAATETLDLPDNPEWHRADRSDRPWIPARSIAMLCEQLERRLP